MQREIRTVERGRAKILWIDDEPDHALSLLLKDCGCDIEWATTGAAGLERATQTAYDAIVLDVRLGDMSGLTVMKRLAALATCPPVLMVTGYYIEHEVLDSACQCGATAVAYKPFLDEYALATALRVVIAGRGSSPLLHERHKRPQPGPTSVDRTALDPSSEHPSEAAIVAVSPEMRAVLEWVERAGPTDTTILLTGETGVGKEVIARALHRASRRHDWPFVVVDCDNIPETLFESELFGHRKGAFTGAASDKTGLIEAAHRATLFLDEIGDLPLTVQGHLLRFLETGEIRRLGETKAARIDVRVIAATNRPLWEDVRRGRFREDLYFRLAVLPRRIPPLRERRDDIEPLIARWLPRFAQRHRRPLPEIAPGALAVLRAHDWPGNVRALRNVLERAVCLASDAVIAEDDVKTILSDFSTGDSVPATTDPEMRRTLSALEAHGGNKSKASRALGISRTTFWRRLQRYGFTAR